MRYCTSLITTSRASLENYIDYEIRIYVSRTKSERRYREKKFLEALPCVCEKNDGNRCNRAVSRCTRVKGIARRCVHTTSREKKFASLRPDRGARALAPRGDDVHFHNARPSVSPRLRVIGRICRERPPLCVFRKVHRDFCIGGIAG